MSILLDHRVDVIPHPFLIVCEGFSDAKFIVNLLRREAITNCNVGCPSRAGGHGDGKTAIPSYLQAVNTSIILGKANLRGLLVVADTDGNEEEIFADMAKALEDAGFHRPVKCFQMGGDAIRTAIFLIPGEGRTGTLENILWDAAVQKNPLVEECVEAFAKCIGDPLSSCTENQKAKIKMSALVAASCRDNPWASAAMIWHSDGNPVPIESSCFSHVTNFLVDFTNGC
jgi:hypothetical protein